MNRYKSNISRDQLSIQPLCLDDMIPEDSEVRALETIIEKMDILSLSFEYAETKQTGRMPYSPADMFKLYAYSYYNGIRSSRKIERECYRNVEVIWLINGLKPDFKTIADFRKNNKTPIKEAFKKFGMICEELGLIGKEMVAVDGSKFRASNSRLAYYSEAKIDKRIEYHKKATEEYIKLLDKLDKDEDKTAPPKYTKEQLNEKIDNINKRIEELETMREEVRENGSIYETDTDSKMMKMNNQGTDICHNVQIAVDSKNHIIVAVDVTSEPVDKEQLYNISSQAKENMKSEALTVIADRGYYSASQFEKCEKDSIIPIVPRAKHTRRTPDEEYSKDNFVYDFDRNGYICPEGHLLTPFQSNANSIYKDTNVYRNMIACENCAQKEKCTTQKSGRTIKDRPLAEFGRRVDERVKQHPELSEKRKQLVEHPFGTVKRALGFDHFLTRGTENVRTESVMHFFAYNLKRIINICGTMKLAEQL